MPKIISDIEQGTPEWHQLRLGSVGGSSISAVLAKGQGKMRKALMYRLAGEILSGVPATNHRTPYMDRGHEFEGEARSAYEFLTDREVVQVGMVAGDVPRTHYSPDGLIGDDGIVELKVQIPSVYVETVDTKKIPLDYLRQCHMGLFVTGRDWVDFAAYCPEMQALWVQRVERDESEIEIVQTELLKFLKELDELVERVRN